MNWIAGRWESGRLLGWGVGPAKIRLLVSLCATIMTIAGPPVSAQAASGLFELIEEVPTPAPLGGQEPSLTTHDNALYMSWMELAGQQSRVMMAIRTSTGWTDPRLVQQGDDLFVNWADFPGVAVFDDGTIAVHWLREVGGSNFDYQIEIALSGDDGVTWSKPLIPHDDRSSAQHGFVSMLPDGRDALSVIWLDGRAYGTGGDGPLDLPGAMQLRATTLMRDGTMGPDEAVDLQTCSCCQTSLASTGTGTILAVYRDRAEGEIRDISVVRLTDQGWEEPATVHEDGWELSGCPVNGPAIAADGDDVAVAWFTGANDVGAVKVAFSDNAARSFGTPVRIDLGNPIGRVDLELLDDGTALVSWVEWVDGNEVLYLCQTDGGTGCIARQLLATNSAGASINFPRMARLGREIFVAWTQPTAAGDSLALRRLVLAGAD